MFQKNILLPSELKIVSEDGNKAVCEIENLYPGYGHTLGNSIRRVILSSIPGVAVTKVFIKDIPHEFTTVEGVKEDVINIVLNLKRVIFNLESIDDTIMLKLSVKGGKEVTASDIELPSQVKILNPEQYLFTISKGYSFEMEFEISRGLGYVPKEAIKNGKLAPGEIIMDTSFTPIRRVSYEVENMRVGGRTDFNKIIFKVETDGSINPVETIKNAINIMTEQLMVISGKEIESSTTNNDDSIVKLNLDENLLTKLAKANIMTISELKAKDNEELTANDIDNDELEAIKKSLK